MVWKGSGGPFSGAGAGSGAGALPATLGRAPGGCGAASSASSAQVRIVVTRAKAAAVTKTRTTACFDILPSLLLVERQLRKLAVLPDSQARKGPLVWSKPASSVHEKKEPGLPIGTDSFPSLSVYWSLAAAWLQSSPNRHNRYNRHFDQDTCRTREATGTQLALTIYRGFGGVNPIWSWHEDCCGFSLVRPGILGPRNANSRKRDKSCAQNCLLGNDWNNCSLTIAATMSGDPCFARSSEMSTIGVNHLSRDNHSSRSEHSRMAETPDKTSPREASRTTGRPWLNYVI